MRGETTIEVPSNNKEGNWWYSIKCREATPGLPAITIDAPNGKKYVCHKLK